MEDGGTVEHPIAEVGDDAGPVAVRDQAEATQRAVLKLCTWVGLKVAPGLVNFLPAVAYRVFESFEDNAA